MNKRLVIVRHEGGGVGALMEVTRVTSKRLYGRALQPKSEWASYFPGLSGGPSYRDRAAEYYVAVDDVLVDDATEEQWRGLWALSNRHHQQRDSQRAQHRDAEKKLAQRQVEELAAAIAQGIEARRGETRSGSTGEAGESPVAKGDAP